ncbi:DUF2490 domain-containing protein [uncultured Polaribacter sp.]|uniref:DUF2490 domain-containing protein n=1 Tax=uncultured Polaribacter sp. TaxID=174711 RepID=UPI00260E5E8A|nr:DUF2490 domain-containing protein [uncultured Polaribacter sp.]
MKTKSLLFLTFFVGLNVFSQSNTDLVFLPKVVLSKKINKVSKWVNSVEQRTIFYDENLQLTHNLLDISSIYSLKTSLNQSFNFGYILRFRGTETIHRTFQHYNILQHYNALKIGHRFALEQFYQVKKQTTFRSRYRVSTELPLNGERIDVKEFYLKLGNEYLYAFAEKDLEIRLTPYLGYQVSAKDKIEFGIDYRVSNFIQNATENQFWFRATWYISLQ